ncbi:MAG: TetR/AcrR family transcriptional regulator [Anaerolineae bacterium]|nr:TetR/AcrR family transcriptional regulator [Anaerolineae bacterium]
MRTRAMLRAALLGLLKEKPFSSITVRDITSRATLNNATFYLHYTDKWDLLDGIVHEIQDALTDSAPFFPLDPLDPTYEPKLDIKLFTHIQTYWEFYKLMLGKHGVPSVAHTLRHHLERIAEATLEEVLPNPADYPMPKSLILRFFASAYIGIIEWWLDSKTPATPHDLAGWLWDMQRLLITLGTPPDRDTPTGLGG